MKKTTALPFIFFYSFLALASDQSNCESILKAVDNKRDVVSVTDPYRWLENESSERNAWLMDQKMRTNQYLKTVGMDIRSYWKKVLGEKLLGKTVIKMLQVDNENVVELISNGLGKSYDVVLKKNGQLSQTLFTSAKNLRLDHHFGIMNIWRDPNQKYVLIPVAYDGSIDIIDIHVIEMATGKQIDLIPDANNVEPVWEDSETLIYRKLLQKDYISLKRNLHTKVDQINSFNYGAPENSPHKKYVIVKNETATYFKKIDDINYVRVNHKMEEVLGETDNAIFFTSKKDGWETLHRLQIGKDGTSFGHYSTIKSKQGIVDAVLDDQNWAIAKYRYGAEQWAILIDETGAQMQQIEVPNCCQLVNFKQIDDQNIEILLDSQIRKKQKFVYNLERKSFNVNVNQAMLTDDQGREFENSFITAKSLDGGVFPVRLTHLKGLKLDGQNPSLVEAYGGFSSPGYIYPRFDFKVKELLNNGGVYAAPAIRGGDELGPIWQKQAKFEGKQNTFNDMAATLQTIQKLGYTRPERTAIMGWSNGGLLIGAMSVQFPELFKIGIVGNGVLDMMRKDHLDPKFDDGWSYEYGNLESPTAVRYLQKYSPVHNAKENKYPTVMVVNGTNDSRVNSIHSFKFAAALQDAQKGDQPIMLLPVKDSGHWVTSPDLENTHAYISLLYIWSAIFNETGVQLK